MPNRTERIRVRLTKAELEHLKSASEKYEYNRFRNGKGNFSDYLRELLLSGSGYRNNTLKIQMKELRYELRKIGVNVNQIAKKINAGFGTAADVKELNNNLKEIRQSFEKYQKEVEELWRLQN